MSAPAGSFWRSVLAACQELASQQTTESLLSLATGYMRAMGAARCVSVFVREPDGGLVLRARAGVPVEGAETHAFPLERDGSSCGVVELAGPAFDDDVRAGLTALAGQLATGLVNASLYAELEQLVEREMTMAVEREQAMQLVLDSMAEGLLVCDLTGEISPIRSKVVADWFGQPTSGTGVWAYLAGDDPDFAAAFELAFSQMADDLLPFEVNLSNVPKLLRREGRAYSFDCRQVMSAGRFEQIVIKVTDVSEALAQEKLARAARELPDVVGNLLRDREGFDAMIGETERLLADLAVDDDASSRARIIHTLKGNSSVWGFSGFSELCHELEETLDGDASALNEVQVAALAEAWAGSLRPVRVFRAMDHDEQSTSLRISNRDHGEVLERLERREDQAIISAVVREWSRAPLRAPLDTLARQAERLAESLGKDVRVVVEADGRAPGLPVTSLIAGLLHAVRNALDHGVEPADERVARGKSPSATLRLSASTALGMLQVVLEDDGRGIDWSAVRARAAALGLPASTDEDAHEALFACGLSTMDHATPISGRGVGMNAVREAFRRLGGSVRVETSLGHGTRVVCRAPIAAGVARVAA